MKQLPIGLSDFKKLREQDFYYIDKTLFIKEIFDHRSEVLLLPRPRRFGKTLNMSMLYYFFSNSGDNNHLFKDTAITKYPDAMEHQGKYPVIFLTFKDIKVSSWQEALAKIAELIGQEFCNHEDKILPHLTKREQEYYDAISSTNPTKTQLENSLKWLSSILTRVHKNKVIILLDEYDAPIHAAHQHGYYPQMTEFIRNLFSAALKDNSSLELSVLTGILRTAREGIFSGLNNLRVYSVLQKPFSSYFGFTEQETATLLGDCQLQALKGLIKEWYNGYNFAKITIYNPWSIINCAHDGGTLIPYWANTSDNALLIKILAHADDSVKMDLESLLSGKTIRQEIDEALIFPGIEQQRVAVWSLLLFSGYLTTQTIELIEGQWICDLTLPNKEISLLYKKLIKDSFNRAIAPAGFEHLYQALQKGDGVTFEKIINKYLLNSISMFDLPNNEPEKSYHLFVLGLLVTFSDTYEVISNRESGYGRYDIMLLPKDTKKRGIVIEFKKADDTDHLEEVAQEALQQIHDKAYATQLLNRGISTITAFGIAFKGKHVLLRQETL